MRPPRAHRAALKLERHARRALTDSPVPRTQRPNNSKIHRQVRAQGASRRHASKRHEKRLERRLRPPRRTPADRALNDDTLSATFQAVADPTRRIILARLAQGEATVQGLA